MLRASTMIAVVFLPAVACAKPDLSTDEGVREFLQKAEGRAEPYEESDICVERPADLKGIILIGHFAYDRGCEPGEVIIDGKLYPYKKASQPALQKLGWPKEQSKARVALALKWTRYGMMKYEGSILSEKPETFDEKGFHTIESGGVKGGGAYVTLWYEVPPGMQCGDGFERVRFEYGADGALKERKSLGGFFVPCAR